MFKRIKKGFKNLTAAINRFFSGVSNAIFGTPTPEQQPLLAEVEIAVAVTTPAPQQIIRSASSSEDKSPTNITNLDIGALSQIIKYFGLLDFLALGEVNKHLRNSMKSDFMQLFWRREFLRRFTPKQRDKANPQFTDREKYIQIYKKTSKKLTPTLRWWMMWISEGDIPRLQNGREDRFIPSHNLLSFFHRKIPVPGWTVPDLYKQNSPDFSLLATCTCLGNQQILDYIYSMILSHNSNALENGLGAVMDDPWNSTLLHYAARCNQSYDVILSLINQGAVIDAACRNGATPLCTAAIYGQLEAARHLLSLGANINAVSATRSTPLHHASEEGHLEMIELLLGAGANVNAVMKNGATPLTKATVAGNLEVVKLLIEKGADIHALTQFKVTALGLAAGNGHLKILEHLIEKGAIIDATDNEGTTPICVAAAKGHFNIVSRLLNAGASLQPNRDGETPIFWAKKKGHSAIVKILEVQNHKHRF